MSIIGTLVVKLLADVADYQKNMDDASSKADAIGKKLSTVGGSLTKGVTLPIIGMGAAAILATSDWVGGLDQIMDATGLTEAQTAGLLVAMQKYGLGSEDAAKSMTIFAKGMTDVNGELGPAGKQLEALGVNIFDASGNIRPMNELIQEAADVLGPMADGIIKTEAETTLFGRSGAELGDVLKELSKDGWEKNTKDAEGYGLVLGGDALTNSIEFGKNTAGMKLQLQGMGVSLGTTLMPLLTTLMGYLKQGMDWFSQLSPSIKTTILVVLGLAAAIGPLLLVLGTLIPVIGTVAAFLAGPLVAAAAPVIGVILAIIAVVGIIIYLWRVMFPKAVEFWKDVFDKADKWFRTTWNDLKIWWENLLSNISTFFKDLWEDIRTWWKDLIEDINTFFSDTWTNLKTTFFTLLGDIDTKIRAVWNAINTWWTGLIETIRSYFWGRWDTLKTNFFTLLTEIDTKFRGVWNAAKTWWDGLIEGIRTTFWEKWNTLKTDFFTMLADIDTKFRTIWSGIRDFFGDIKDTIVGWIQDLIKWFEDLFDWFTWWDNTGGTEKDKTSLGARLSAVGLATAAPTSTVNYNYFLQGRYAHYETEESVVSKLKTLNLLRT